MRNKKIISSLLIISMIMCLLPMKMFMASESPPEPTVVPLKIIPDRTDRTYRPGGTITYTIKMGPVTNFGALQLKLDIPDGVTFKGGQLADNLGETLKINNNVEGTEYNAFATFNNDNKKIVIYGANYTSEVYTDIATFTCKVDQNAAEGTYGMSLIDPILTYKDATEIPVDVSNLESTVTVTAAAQPQYLLGDVNGDGSVDAQDMQAVFDIMTSKIDNSEYISRADVNDDSSIDAQDMQMIFDIMTGKIVP